jgi:ubiquinone/menaquinone biosynthesis C-methylase UbiE
MNHEEYEVMFQVEDHHWWYLGMEQITCGMLDKAVGRGHALQVLDAGCGTGAVMQYLKPYGRVTGFDYSTEALRFSRQRGHVRLTQASVMQLPFADREFDLIVSFDVISEAGVDDVAALGEFTRVLKPGGHLLVRLPAYRWMRGRHDVAVNVSHRYTRSEIRRNLQRANLTPVKTSYANTFLFPIAMVKRWSERLMAGHQTGSDLTLDPGPLNGLLRTILSAEAPLIRSIGLPLGLTVVALAQKEGK